MPADVQELSLEHWLGAAGERYFGAGYKDVTYQMRAARPGLADFAVHYPEAWSLDAAGQPRETHLSSVDAVVLTLMATQAQVTVGRTNETARVSSVELRSGRTPWLDLTRVPLAFSTQAGNGNGEDVVIEATAGNIRTRIGLREGGRHGDTPSLRIPPGSAPTYPAALRAVSSQTRISQVDRAASSISAEHEFTENESSIGCYGGIEGARWPSITVIDYLVTMGQMSQAVVCLAKGITRAGMGNLWMRTMNIRATGRSTPLGAQITTETRLVHDRAWVRDGTKVHDLQVESRSSDGIVASAKLAFFDEQTPASTGR
ncbi:AvrD family protein [Leucobacter sp. VD1]|uniref:AvrD family protein n=1 Tax=Leucobacter sp. VD1 TaxID=3080381 RepID=UPI00301B096E